jgi:hypothetical protein
MKVRAIIAAAVVLLLSINQASAWNGDGHRVAGSLADLLLKPPARAQVASILGFTLRIAGPWADCVKSVVRNSDNTYTYHHSDKYGAPCTLFEKPDASEEQLRMEDYVARNWMLCKYKNYTAGCQDTYHFADVPIQRDDYGRSHAGTNDRDIVSTINAAIAVLKDKPPQAPVSIRDKKGALFVLAHMIGDLHQPLHVGAIYLDAGGNLVDPPDGSTPGEDTDTRGGNSLFDQGQNFHFLWDEIPADLGDDATTNADMKKRAEMVAPTPGPVEGFAVEWAGESVRLSRAVFADATFTMRNDHPKDGSTHWDIGLSPDHDTYWKIQGETQRQQLAKAGARLAELLNAIWP